MPGKFIKIFLILLALLISGFLIYIFIKNSAEYTVLKIEDGDSIYLDFNNNGVAEYEEKKGLSDIDAFETKANRRLSRQAKDYGLSEQEALELGYLAKEFLKEKILNKKVKVKFTDKRKRYALIYLNGELVQDELIESGLAVPYKRSGRYEDNSQQLEEARKRLENIVFKPVKKPQPQNAVTEKPIPDVHTEFIDLYFIDPTKYKKPAGYCRTAACQALLREINKAKESIDFAIYGISKQPEIFNALVEAQGRGIKVRWVTDMTEYGTNIYSDTDDLMQSLKNFNTDKSVQTKSEKNMKFPYTAIMHNKFFIFDRKKVWTGSTNISSTGIGGYNCNVGLIVKSDKVSSLFFKDFEQMYNGKFHTLKNNVAGNENIILPDNTNISVYFSPVDKAILTKIIPIIDQAEKYIYVPIFYLTHKKFTNSLIKAHKRGVNIKIIADATSSQGEYTSQKTLRKAGVPVKVENWPGKMHMKSLIIDDEYLIISSMNLTKQGEKRNDENVLIIKNNPELVIGYKKYFSDLWARIPDKWLNETPKPESSDSIGSCTDGIDNDHDKYIDMNDYDCSR